MCQLVFRLSKEKKRNSCKGADSRNFLEHCKGCRFINMKKTKLLQRSRFTQLAGTLQRMQIHKHVTTRPHRSKQFQKSEFMGCSRTHIQTRTLGRKHDELEKGGQEVEGYALSFAPKSIASIASETHKSQLPRTRSCDRRTFALARTLVHAAKGQTENGLHDLR